MFGYRLVRTRDWNDARADLIGTRAELATRVDTMQTALEALAEAKAEARAKAAMVDLLTTDINLLRAEVAGYRQKLTGVPQVTAQIQAGQPMRSDMLAASSDLFEDVGDTKAAELARAGMLHDVDPVAEPLRDGLG